MMVVFAFFFAFFGGPNVSSDGGMIGGARPHGAAVIAPPVVRSTGVRSDGGSGGPSLIPPMSVPLADGGSGGPSARP